MTVDECLRVSEEVYVCDDVFVFCLCAFGCFFGAFVRLCVCLLACFARAFVCRCV